MVFFAKSVQNTFLFLLLFPDLAFAHPGGLDKQGGHFDRKKITPIIAIKNLTFLFTSNQKKPTGEPTPAHTVEYITVKTGRTG